MTWHRWLSFHRWPLAATMSLFLWIVCALVDSRMPWWWKLAPLGITALWFLVEAGVVMVLHLGVSTRRKIKGHL